MTRIIFATLLFTVATVALADSVIVTHTQGWKSVPVVIDSKINTYTIQGQVPQGEYYFTYPGFRCITDKTSISGVDALTFRAQESGGQTIYCYPEGS